MVPWHLLAHGADGAHESAKLARDEVVSLHQAVYCCPLLIPVVAKTRTAHESAADKVGLNTLAVLPAVG